ncbi:MAG TPA: hypothetical protein VGH91_04480 [Gammaproteobacteria bacterium]|jgi:hypothetical protein
MADLSDVGIWFEAQCTTICYPNGSSQPPITGSGKTISLGRGWPDPKTLDAVMAAGVGNAYVNIYPMPGMERNTTRFPKAWQQVSVTAATLTLTVSGRTVTVGGTPAVGQGAVVSVNTQPYGYALVGGDTLNSIAAALAALIPGASAVGAVVTVPGVSPLSAAVSVTGTAAMETRRQQRVFGVYVWAPDPVTRDTVAQAIDGAMAVIERFTLPDGFSARLIYHGTMETDELQARLIYKRSLMYSVEYATTTTQTTQTVGATSVGIASATG